MNDDLELRPATADDLPAILELLRESMGRADDPRFEALFRWKHFDGAFGPSPMWVADSDGRVVGLRTFMRWEFERSGEVVRCVRAVDTATHPEFQGRGIFSRLTLAALPTLTADGVQFVFNTPNTQSRPGYLKMGWQEIGRAGACVRPLSLPGVIRLARSRVPASHWSEPPGFGVQVPDVLADPRFSTLLSNRRGDPARFSTHTSPDYYAWRYGSPLLAYRAVVSREGIEGGVAFVRLRRRGRAREVVLAALPAPTREASRSLLRDVVREMRGHADYLLGIAPIRGCVGVSSFGPVMTTRDLAATAPTAVSAFDLALGDLELF